MLRDQTFRCVVWFWFVAPGHALAYGAGFPDASVEMVAGAGHAVPLEKPDELAGKIAAFVKG